MPLDQEIAQHRSYLMRFARLQLRNDTWAEDAVSETMVAALSKPESFGQRSQLKTWLVGILKHKVLDALRQRSRESMRQENFAGDGPDEVESAMFAGGYYVEPPADWGNPEQAVHSTQFFAVLEACTDTLPPAMGRVFLMREWLELSCDEVCNELGITATNLYVLLHRARLRLRECLGLNWFAGPR